MLFRLQAVVIAAAATTSKALVWLAVMATRSLREAGARSLLVKSRALARACGAPARRHRVGAHRPNKGARARSRGTRRPCGPRAPAGPRGSSPRAPSDDGPPLPARVSRPG